MIVVATTTAVLVGALVALLVVGGALLFATGLRARASAAGAVAARERIEGLLAGAPMQPLVIRADGRVEAGQRVVDWLGLGNAPHYLQELDTAGWGVETADAAALSHDVTACQRSARGFTRTVHSRDAGHAISVQGERRGDAVLLWFYD